MTVETIFVLGMHRSGTSALVRTLNLLGLAISRDLLPANDFNEPGYWESRQIVRFNDELLAAFDRSWADPKPMPAGWQTSEAAARAVPSAQALLDEEFAGQVRIVIKDPRLSRVLPVWREALAGRGDRRPACLICCRNPLEVHRSLMVRDGLDLEHALHLWMTYLLEAEYHTRGLPRAVVHYESLLQEWPWTLRQALATMGAPTLAVDGARAGDVDAFISGTHRHHMSTLAELRAHADVPDAVKDAYALVLRDLNLAAEVDFDRLRRHWQLCWEALNPGEAGSSFAPQVVEWHVERSLRFEKERKIKAALAACDDAIALRPDLARLHHRKGNLLLKAGRPRRAEAAQRRAIALKGNEPSFHQTLAAVLARMNRNSEAIEALERAIEHGPDIARLHHRRGLLLLKMGRREEAEAAQRRAIELDDSPHGFHEALGSVLAQTDRAEEAINALQQAIERAPDLARLYHRKGVLEARLGRFDEAEASHRRAIALNDRAHWFHEALASLLARMGRNDEAVEAIRRAVERAPENGWLCQREAILLANAGRLAEADAALTRSLELDRKSMDCNEGLSGLVAAGDAMAIRDLSRFFAGMTARYWAEDLEMMLSEGEFQACKGQGWPLGRCYPERIVPPLEATGPSCDAPLMSVMIPVYNVADEGWLRKCIESVLVQDHGPQWAEIVIVDDASDNDATLKIAEHFADRVAYRRNEANLGLVANHNHCMNIARGQIVHYLHQDDYVEPDFYERLVEPLLRDDSLVAAYANHRYVDEHARTTRRQALARTAPGPLRDCLRGLAQRQMIEFSSVIVRRSTYLAVGGFSPSLVYAFDWDMWSRVAMLGPIWYEPACLASTRAHRHSATHRIGPLDRLIDEMRCVFHILAALPPNKRRQTARVSFTSLMPKFWSMLVSPPHELAASERDRLARFLTLETASTDDNMMLAAQARRLGVT